MDHHPNTLETILCEAVEIVSADERAAYLEKACGNDPQLREQVQKLLDAHFRAGNFLDQPPLKAAPTIDLPTISEGPGTVIGRYKLLQQIGEGGFGVVFMAEQVEPVRRKVALKVIKPGMDTKQVIARFQAEQQALAMMDHPNIARVFDGGTTESGRPYFVMELVRGISVTDYCDQNSFTPKERLELFVSACRAVQHAHQKGIVHRDIKPSNVLVTLRDGTPMVKVIDFGIAKAIDKPLTERTLFTEFGQMIGTPAYMSPEQAQLSALDVDTRTDVYSLGVLLYELLTGATPFDKKRLCEAAFDEVRRIIREEEPPAPSKKISTLGETLVAVASHRGTEPKGLSALVRGDLDWIVMKALEKDRTRRYETASTFAADVQRYLNDEPVDARPPSVGYRFRKFVRRNKILAAVASAIAGAVVLTMLVTVSLTYLLLGERKTLTEEREILRKQNEELLADRRSEMKRRARSLERKKDYAAAQEAYRELLALDRANYGQYDARTLATMRSHAYTVFRRDGPDEFLPLFDSVIDAHKVGLGEHVETSTLTEIREYVRFYRFWQLSGEFAQPATDLTRARELVRKMPESHLLSAWARAWLEYRYGDPKKGLEIVGAHGGWFPHWLPRALLLEKLGRSEEARDWFMAWYEWAETACYPAQLPFVALTAELGEKAAAVLKQPLPPPSEKSPASYLRLYDSLLKRTPDDPALVLRHGACHARLGQWKAAANDFAFAAKHTHHELPRLDLAFALFELGDLEGCRSAWRLSADRMLTTRNVQDVSTLLTLHSLAPDAGFDPQVLLAISEQIPTFDATDDDAAIGASVCRGIALYSCGRDREAIELLVDGGRRRDLVLAQAFRAMAYHRLGDSVKAREALAQARRTIALRDAKRPIPDCEYIFDRYLLDCRLQRVVLRAEQLIEPSAKAADANK